MWECHQCVSKEEVLSVVTVNVDLLGHCLLSVVKSVPRRRLGLSTSFWRF